MRHLTHLQREADDAMLAELAGQLAVDGTPETAALVLVANTLLNLDAALNR